ncbi:hypothetical protein AB4Y64_09140 [Lysobacter sp. TAF61]|uniref:hypothetical protein n=1 Tax=Lysobacter sp. TAF61 TaxID=3233072 RepID=UPI003F949126
MKVVLAFILLYFDAGVAVGDFRLPSATSLLVPLLLGGSLQALRASVPPLMALCAIAIVSLIATPASPPVDKIVSSWVQTSVSIVISMVVLRWTMRVRPAALSASMLLVSLLMFLVIALEYFGPLAEMSSRVGEYIYSSGVGFSYYGSGEFSLERDITLAGTRRPTAFAAEPSIAAIGVSVAVVASLSSNRSHRWLLAAIAVLFCCWYMLRSPIPIGAAIVCAVMVAKGKSYPLKRVLQIGSISILGLAGLLLVSERLLRLFSSPEAIAESSEGIRLALPLVNTLQSWLGGAWLGAGPGAQYDLSYVASLNPFQSTQFGTNAWMLGLFYYGPILFPAFVYLYSRCIRLQARPARIGVELWCYSLFLGCALGALESPRLFGFIAMLVGYSVAFSSPRAAK